MKLKDFACPTCSAQDWKSRKEQVQRSISVCGNCGYSPSTVSAEHFNEESLRAILSDLSRVQGEKVEALRLAQQEYEQNQDSPDAVILGARVAKAERELSMADRRWLVVDKLVEIVGLAPAQGMVTLHVPEIGIFTQITWGGYDLLKGLERGLVDLKETHSVTSC